MVKFQYYKNDDGQYALGLYEEGRNIGYDSINEFAKKYLYMNTVKVLNCAMSSTKSYQNPETNGEARWN